MLLPQLQTQIAAMAERIEMEIVSDSEKAEVKPGDEILEYAIQYAQDGSYPPNITKEKKRAIRKRAALLTVDKGEVFFNPAVIGR